jgi:predicted nucleic acid-binding protein
MATIFLDSSVIFDHLNGRFGRTEFLDELIEQGHLLACCPVNITEVYAGLRPGEEKKTAAFIESLEFFPVTQPWSGLSGCHAPIPGGILSPEEGLEMWPLPPAR